MIDVRGLTKVIDTGIHRVEILKGIDLSIPAGQFAAIMGASGSGKSTLLDIISGLFAQTGGDIAIDGEHLPAAKRLGHAAYMRQRDLLMPWRTALDNAADDTGAALDRAGDAASNTATDARRATGRGLHETGEAIENK